MHAQVGSEVEGRRRGGRAARLVAALAALVALGCGGDGSVAVDGGVAADAGALDVDAGPPPSGLQVRAHAVNIVDAAAAAEARAYIRGESAELTVGAAAFYAHFDDAYDFLYVFTDGPIEGADAFARYTPVRRDALPSVGLDAPYANPAYGEHPHLRGAIGVQLTDVGNGPTLHETLHHWATFLDRSFGFGRDRDFEFGAHWGVAGVHGQHGGFDPATARCGTPSDSPPPCMPDADGVIRFSTAEFGPNANGGDSTPYAPIELYLMGLLRRAEVPSPILVLDGAHFVTQDASTGRMQFEITGTHDVSLDEIVARHGERPPAPPEERAFRGAFVSFSDAPLSSARMDALERWAAVFGGDASTPGLLSFEAATGGRATMQTTLGPAR